MSIIYHIAHRSAWETAQATGAYRVESLDTEGFIHASTEVQVPRVANAFYRGQTELVLLCIETDKVKPEVRFEPPVHPQGGQPQTASGELFPHIYGALNLDAVVKVINFVADVNGVFSFPAS